MVLPVHKHMHGTPEDGARALITASDIVKEYRRSGSRTAVRALDGVSFAIGEAESFGLVGESGSGKSTLARLLLGLERPTAGAIAFEGRNLSSLSTRELRALRSQMQIVFQDPVASLNRRKTVEQIVSAPLAVHNVGSSSTRKRRVHELLELVGLNSRHARRYPSELSGGQAQRVGIARALALEPRFVIFDEAVSALDVSVRAQILNLIRDLQAELRLTYLFISHDLAIVRYMSTRVAVMYMGRIVETGTRDQLFTAPRDPYTQELLRSIPEPAPKRQPTTSPNRVP
jgi:peptide/nickel transport system ATP-binding protein